jgi:hypothetical protein
MYHKYADTYNRDNEINKGPQLGLDDWTDVNMGEGIEMPVVFGNAIFGDGTDTVANSMAGMGFNLSMMGAQDQTPSWTPTTTNGSVDTSQGAFA